MKGRIYTIEELMLDDSFVNYCLSTGAAVSLHWKNIIRDNPEQEEIFNEAKRLVLALHGGLSRPEINRQIDYVRRQLQEKKKDTVTVPAEYEPSLSSALVVTGTGRLKRKFFRIAFSYLAIASIVIAAGWWIFSRSASSSSEGQSVSVQAGHFQSQPGQRQTVSLPDGSVVILNSNSTVSWNAGFNTATRDIQLTGEAFFKVAKDPRKPFTVITGNISTTALGTEFYVHGRKEGDNHIEVDLLEGKVQLTTKNKNSPALILFPGEKGESIDGLQLQRSVFNAGHLRSWINGRISFNETPALKALKQLEAWYGVKIIVKNQKALKDRVITGDYQNDSLQDILKVICFSISSRFSLTGDTVIIG